METTKNGNQGHCSCPSLDITDASEECCDGYAGIGSTLYIGTDNPGEGDGNGGSEQGDGDLEG